ncbi:MAG: ATP-binding protein [Thermoleophilia bacterium]
MASEKRVLNTLAARLAVLLVVVAIPFVGVVLYDARQARTTALVDAEREVGYLAQVLGGHVLGHLDRAREVSVSMVGVLSSDDPQPDDALFARVLAQHPEMSALFVTDSRGEVVAGAPAIHAPTFVGDRDYWTGVQNGVDFAVGGYTVGRVSGVTTLPVAAALRDERGVLEGAVVAGLRLEALAAAVESARRKAGDIYVIVDRNGVVLARSPNSDFQPGQRVGDPQLRERIARRAEVTALLRGPDGVARLYAMSLVSEDSGIIVAAGTPQAVAYAEADRIVRTHGIVLLGLVIFIFFVAKIGVDILVRRPVRRLAAAAAGVRDGDLSVRTGLTLSGGELGHLAGAFDDMASALEQRTGELVQAETRYRTVVESSPNGVLVHEDGRIVLANQAAARLAGAAAPSDLIGRYVMEFVPAEFRALVRLRHEEAYRTGATSDLSEQRFLRLDGSEVEIAVISIPLIFGETTAINTIIQDISSRKQAETAVKESQERAAGAQRLETVGRLAGGVAHDFNNLLTAVIGYAELGRTQSGQDPALGEVFDEIRSSADRAAALTRQLLAFSRQQPLRPRVVNLNSVTESVSGLLGQLIGEDVELVLRCADGLWPVEVDPGQVEQVIMNLVINARHAMPDGGLVTVETANVELDEEHVSMHLESEKGPYVSLAVSDTGAGIDPEILPRIFEPFFTTKELGEGTGLGLSTVYGIVKQSGGSIRVYSEPNRGTTFRVYLPRVDKPVDWVPEDRPISQQHVTAGGETILVVEDEPAVRALTVRILEGAGYTVMQAGDPAGALELYEDHGALVHLLLTDVVLPGMSGRALAEVLTGKRGAHPRVLFMSGYTKDAIVHDGRLDRGVEFLEKPFTADGLLSKVRDVLDRPMGGQRDLAI